MNWCSRGKRSSSAALFLHSFAWPAENLACSCINFAFLNSPQLGMIFKNKRHELADQAEAVKQHELPLPLSSILMSLIPPDCNSSRGEGGPRLATSITYSYYCTSRSSSRKRQNNSVYGLRCTAFREISLFRGDCLSFWPSPPKKAFCVSSK